MDSAEHDFLLDLEQADARLEVIIESDKTWDVELSGLDAIDTMLLLVGISMVIENYPNESPQLERALGIEDEILSQTGKLGETLNELNESCERYHESHQRSENPMKPLKFVYSGILVLLTAQVLLLLMNWGTIWETGEIALISLAIGLVIGFGGIYIAYGKGLEIGAKMGQQMAETDQD